MSLKIVFALVFSAALCCAQTDASSSSGTPAKETPTPASAPPVQAPPSAPETNQSPNTAGPASSQPAPKPAAGVKATAEKPGTAPAHKPYVIGPLDVLTIKVWNNTNLSGAVAVDSDGMLSLPLIGEIKADGLTQRELKEKLVERLRDFFNNSPDVDVTVSKVNSKRYFVYGGVLRGGEFPLVQETTVMDALSSVGGFKDFANTKKIYILRGDQKFEFNYKDVSKGKHLEQNRLIENGDRIFVPE